MHNKHIVESIHEIEIVLFKHNVLDMDVIDYLY